MQCNSSLRWMLLRVREKLLFFWSKVPMQLSTILTSIFLNKFPNTQEFPTLSLEDLFKRKGKNSFYCVTTYIFSIKCMKNYYFNHSSKPKVIKANMQIYIFCFVFDVIWYRKRAKRSHLIEHKKTTALLSYRSKIVSEKKPNKP